MDTPKTCSPILRSAVVTLTIFLAVSAAFPQAYELQDLQVWTVSGINDSGWVIAVDWYGGDAYVSYLFKNGQQLNLGALVTGGSTDVYGLNNAGQVVGSSWSPGLGGERHAVLVDNLVMTDLGTLGGSVYSAATAINNAGTIAGRSYHSDTDPTPHAVAWNSGVISDLGTLGGGTSEADGINDTGFIVGSSRLPDSTTTHAVLWSDTGAIDLGTLGGTHSWAWAINRKNQAVGYSDHPGDPSGAGFLWEGGLMVNLGIIAPNDSVPGYSSAYGVNDSEEVVGSSTWNADPRVHNTHGFLWRNGVMKDLNDVTDTSGGWEIIRGVGINNAGDIVAIASRYGAQSGVLLHKKDLILVTPQGGEFWISGDVDTVRWLSGLDPATQVRLDLSLDDGQSWQLLAGPFPADTGLYPWVVPDTLSSKARVRVVSLADSSVADTSGTFKFRGYRLVNIDNDGNYIPYVKALDRWTVWNAPEEIWYLGWYSRFDYDGTDPFTGKSYSAGTPASNRIFKKARSANFPDWVSFVRTYNTDACYMDVSAPVYKMAAALYWESLLEPWGGSCFGFAISNALAFRHRPEFQSVFPDFPAFASPIEVGSDTEVIPVINLLWMRQLGKPHLDYRAQVGVLKTPAQTLEDLKTMFIGDYEPVRTLSLMNNGPGGGGHAILAYALHRDKFIPSIFHLSVYDNSNPTVEGSEILIDSSANGGSGTWYFDLWPGWGGTKWLYLRNPAIDYLGYTTLPKADPGAGISPFILENGVVDVNINVRADVAISDDSGRVSGYADSLIQLAIPGSVPLVIDNGSKTPPFGYSLASGSYSVTVGPFDDTLDRIYYFTDNRTFRAERGGANPFQTDRFHIDDGVSIVNPDTGSKSFDLTEVINETIREKVYSLTGIGVAGSDSVRIDNVQTDGLRIARWGFGPSTYDLEVEYNGSSGSRTFAFPGIALGAGTAHEIRPVWDSLGSVDLKIYIDDGADGSIDDSMFVTNQTTGVNGEGPGTVPTLYALYRNYPNPFNPSTTFSYDLPMTSQVRLAVYDLLGREVAVVVDARQESGRKSVEWNAEGLPSGVYFYRLQAGGFTATGKLVIARCYRGAFPSTPSRRT